ncbi:DUF2225 domain-containing protein [Clostridium uliginosum]|uniref:DUF2225 domain-containing protein n=1 Tax=Clostridium uliginosum TaxID=119641 RepID=A0A1I1SGW0_9CLOT|nr:DUF2225 domain-containing protein [Clostridium uliginosum]SFD45691.1 hypothetical protein SAMN05421842_1523 [Clostridium uliginosum]
MNEDENIFSGLEDLGFKDVSNIKIYKKCEEKEDNKDKKSEENLKIKEEMLLYDKKVVCPVCENNFLANAVKTSSYRMKKRESDFYIKYDIINPYFYDVWVCNVCGYASMKSDFHKLKKFEIESIQKNITPKWRGKNYPKIYDINIAIERYKLSLLNYSVMGAKASKKAMNCLKLSWMYRELEDIKNEQIFRGQALIGFKDAYLNEQLPIYGMGGFTIMYLIGELNIRSGNDDEALRYLGDVITAQSAGRKIKDLAIDQRDLIKETLNNNEDNTIKDVVENKKKIGLFSRLFKWS